MLLSIITICYNTPDLVLDLVRSIGKQYEQELKERNLEIIIVDNGSSKESIDKLEKGIKEREWMTLVKSKKNLGFGKGNNLGATKAKGEYLLFLNSDTQVLDKGFLKMIEFLKENNKVGILGGRLIGDDGCEQKSAGSFYNVFNLFFLMFGGGKMGGGMKSPKKIEKADWVSGACMMINQNLFKTIDGFDENIFMYMEDMEICFRAKKKGFLTYFFPDVLVTHKERGSSNRGFAVLGIYEGILYYFKKHKSSVEYRFAWFILYCKALAVYLLGIITNNSYYSKTYGEAIRILKK